MNINRHNYEEYFILYMDNELGSDDRRMVEAFVVQHPDLKEELDLLFQYKLTPDKDILFPGKEDLIKVNGETPVNLTNYEEWLLLYLDNELNADQRIEVEKFMAANPPIQKEWVVLQHTKLQPEQIVFDGKASLYKSQEKVRLLPARWWRAAAAAVLLLGIGFTVAVAVNKRSSGKNEIVKGAGTEKKTNAETSVIMPVKKENPPVNENEIAVADKVRPIPAPVTNPGNKQTIEKNNTVIAKKNKPVLIPSPVKKQDPVLAENNKPSNNLPQPIHNPNLNKNNTTTNALAAINPPKETNDSQKPLTATPVTNPVVLTSPPENPDVVYASLEEGGKNKKNRGFFRKLVRTFEKRTNINATDDDRLLVGGLSIKLK